MALRCMRTSKFTCEASNSGPSTQANLLWLPSSTRQPPHMPVPSTMMELRLTMVLMPSGAVICADGAHHGHRAHGENKVRCLRPAAMSSFSFFVTRPVLAVGAVVGHDVGFAAGLADFVFKDDHLALRAPSIKMTWLSASLSAFGSGQRHGCAHAAGQNDGGAVVLEISEGWPSGPTMSRMESPASSS
jgi:hypothetical protein